MPSSSIEQFLAPTLSPGDVVLDNLAAHQLAGVEAAIRAAGASLMSLPPYSPAPSRQCLEAHRAGLR
jgi:transposase